MRNKKDGLFERIRKECRDFESTMKSLREGYETQKRNAPAVWGNGQFCRNKLKEIEHNFEENTLEVQSSFVRSCKAMIDEAWSVETSRISGIYNTTTQEQLAQLNLLSGIPLDAMEFSALCDRYCKGGYWQQRKLAELAKSNDICLEDVPNAEIQPSIGKRYEVLNQCENMIKELAKSYRDGDTLAERMIANDRRFEELENAWYSGMNAEKYLSEDAKLRRAFSRIKRCPDVVSQSTQLKAELDGCTPKLRNDLIKMLSENPVSDVALGLAGLKEEVENFNMADYLAKKELAEKEEESKHVTD